MANGQGGLNSIESISGVSSPSTTSVERITLQNTDYNYTRTNNVNNQTNFLSLTAHGNTVNFSSNTINNKFGDQNYVGGNMLASEETIHQQYAQKGGGLNFFGMA